MKLFFKKFKSDKLFEINSNKKSNNYFKNI